MQFAPIVLTDSTGTTKDFVPRDITNGVATAIRSNGVPIADKRISISQSRTAGNGRAKVQVKLAIPVVQDVVVNGVSRPTVVRTAYADLTLTFDQTSNAAERADVRSYLYSFLVSGTGPAVIDGLDTLY